MFINRSECSATRTPLPFTPFLPIPRARHQRLESSGYFPSHRLPRRLPPARWFVYDGYRCLLIMALCSCMLLRCMGFVNMCVYCTAPLHPRWRCGTLLNVCVSASLKWLYVHSRSIPMVTGLWYCVIIMLSNLTQVANVIVLKYVLVSMSNQNRSFWIVILHERLCY